MSQFANSQLALRYMDYMLQRLDHGTESNKCSYKLARQATVLRNAGPSGVLVL